MLRRAAILLISAGAIAVGSNLIGAVGRTSPGAGDVVVRPRVRAPWTSRSSRTSATGDVAAAPDGDR